MLPKRRSYKKIVSKMLMKLTPRLHLLKFNKFKFWLILICWTRSRDNTFKSQCSYKSRDHLFIFLNFRLIDNWHFSQVDCRFCRCHLDECCSFWSTFAVSMFEELFVNFGNILQEAFWTIPFCRKNANCKFRITLQNTSTKKRCS